MDPVQHQGPFDQDLGQGPTDRGGAILHEEIGAGDSAQPDEHTGHLAEHMSGQLSDQFGGEEQHIDPMAQHQQEQLLQQQQQQEQLQQLQQLHQQQQQSQQHIDPTAEDLTAGDQSGMGTGVMDAGSGYVVGPDGLVYQQSDYAGQSAAMLQGGDMSHLDPNTHWQQQGTVLHPGRPPLNILQTCQQ